MTMVTEREKLEERLTATHPAVIEILLSKERTLLSRERTAIALGQLALGVAAFGFFVIRFFAGNGGFDWFILLGVGSVILAAYLTYHAWHDYNHFKKECNHLRSKRGHLDMVYAKEMED